MKKLIYLPIIVWGITLYGLDTQPITEAPQESPLSVQPGPQQQKVVQVTPETAGEVASSSPASPVPVPQSTRPEQVGATPSGMPTATPPASATQAQTSDYTQAVPTTPPVPEGTVSATSIAQQAQGPAPQVTTTAPSQAASGGTAQVPEISTPISTAPATSTTVAGIEPAAAVAAGTPAPQPTPTGEVHAIAAPQVPSAAPSPVTAVATAPHEAITPVSGPAGVSPLEEHVAALEKMTGAPAGAPTLAPTPSFGTVTAPTAVLPEAEVSIRPRTISVSGEEVKPVSAQEKKTYVSLLENSNKEAHKRFLQWKVRDPHSSLSPNLRKSLTDKAIQYLVDNSYLSLQNPLSEEAIEDKVQRVAAAFIKKYDPQGKKKIQKRELAELIREVIQPEWTFWVSEYSPYPMDRTYLTFMTMLEEQLTPVDTTLKDWALRFLTSESIIMALPIIQAVDIQGKSFDQLTPDGKKHALQPAIDIITSRFLSNLRAIREKYNLPVSGLLDEAIKHKITHFLYDTFISTLE